MAEASATAPAGRTGGMSALALAAVVAALALLIFVPYLRAGDVPIWVDEGVFGYLPWASRELGQPLYEAGYDNKGPGIFLLYQAVRAYDQAGVERARWLQGALSLAVALLLLAWLSRAVSPTAGALAALAWAALAAFEPDVRALTEVPMLVGATLAFWALWAGMGGGRRWLFAAAGAALGVAFMCKQTAAAELLAAGLLALAAGTGRPGERVGRAALVAAGFAGAFGLTVLWAVATGQLGAFWECAIAAVAGGGSGISGAERLASLAESLRHFFPTKALLLALAVAVPALGLRYTPRGLRAVLGAWLAAAALACVVRGVLFEHQAAQFFAPLAALAGIALAGMLRGATRRRAPWGTAAAPGLLLLAALPLGVLYLRGLERPHQGIWAETGVKDRQAGAWLAAYTLPQDRIYVVGDGVPIYLYAQRLSPLRLFHTIAAPPERQAATLAGLKQTRPAAVVLTATYRAPDTAFREEVRREMLKLGYAPYPAVSPEGYEILLRGEPVKGGL